MAITKSQLKSIVKECLVEILSEGIGATNSMLSILPESPKKQLQKKHIDQPTFAAVLQQNASKTKLGSPSPSPALREAIRREAGGNNVMADIFADTAANTLPTMLENDRSRYSQPQPVGVVERAVAASTPDQLFGEDAASKWAALAFMDPIKK
jgi:hypothetical protein